MRELVQDYAAKDRKKSNIGLAANVVASDTVVVVEIRIEVWKRSAEKLTHHN